MDERLDRLIRDYQSRVAAAIDLLEAVGIERPTSAIEWAARDMPFRGDLGNGATYRKHGIGCAVRGHDWAVDFDFGTRGEFDGFDAWRLWSFGARQPDRYFKTREEFDDAYREAIDQREFVRLDDLFYVSLRRAN